MVHAPRSRVIGVGIGLVLVLVVAVVVVRWRSTLPTGERVLVVGDSVTFISDRELISGDHIHPIPAGSARLAEIEQAAVTTSCR